MCKPFLGSKYVDKHFHLLQFQSYLCSKDAAVHWQQRTNLLLLHRPASLHAQSHRT